MGLCLILPDVLAGIFTKDTEVVGTAKPYIELLAWVYPLSGVATLLAVQLRCRNYAKYPLYISAVAAVVNTCLNYLLIFGHFGFPAMGIKGAALASLMSQVVNLALMVYFYHRTCQFSFDLRMKASEISQYLIMLTPIVVNELLWTLGQNVNTYIYGHMGTSELAGMSLTGPIQGLFIGALFGLSQAAGILIGHRLGKHDYERAYQDSKRLCFYGFVGSLILSIFLVLGENLYIDLYNVGSDETSRVTTLVDFCDFSTGQSSKYDFGWWCYSKWWENQVHHDYRYFRNVVHRSTFGAIYRIGS